MMNSRTKILVVDDFTPMRRAVKNCLAELGFSDICEADDAISALDQLNRENFQLIISDWNMPAMMGAEFLQAVRSNEKLKAIPFLMVTSRGLKEEILAGITGASADYIMKPFDAAALGAKLQLALSE